MLGYAENTLTATAVAGFVLLVSGCGDAGLNSEQRKVNANVAGIDAPEDDYPAPPGTEENQPAPVPKKKNLLKRKTSLVVDKKAAMEKYPHLVEVENTVNTDSYLGAVSSAYIAASSKANIAAFQHNLNIARELNDGNNLPFDEVQTYIKQMNIQFNDLPYYQMYAYDETSGKFVILEDPLEKQRMKDNL